MELWDAYDRDGNRLGVDLVRGEPVPEGMYHIVSETIVRHVNGDYLLMLRDPNKPIRPGEWELGAGGSALKGETPVEAARREPSEETGLRCDALQPVAVVVREENHCLFHLFLAEVDCDPHAITLQEGETVDHRWISPQALKAMRDSGELPGGTKEERLGDVDGRFADK